MPNIYTPITPEISRGKYKATAYITFCRQCCPLVSRFEYYVILAMRHMAHLYDVIHNKNSSGDEIANVNFYAVRPGGYPNSPK